MCLATRHRTHIFTPSEFTCKTPIPSEKWTRPWNPVRKLPHNQTWRTPDFRKSASFNGQMDLSSLYARPWQDPDCSSPLRGGLETHTPRVCYQSCFERWDIRRTEKASLAAALKQQHLKQPWTSLSVQQPGGEPGGGQHLTPVLSLIINRITPSGAA